MTLVRLLIFSSIADVSEGTSTSLISLMNCVSFLTVLIRLLVAKLSKNVPRALIAFAK